MAFLSPIFLLGALAAALPVLVHLVRRTRARRVQFASLMFLRRIEQKTIRKRRLRNLMLLLMRCAALLLLALAFSRPYFTGRNPIAAASDHPSSVILLDVSYSMQYPEVFDRAKQEAHRIVNNAAPNEEIALVQFSGSSEILRPLKADTGEANALLDQAAPGLGATDYLQAIQTASGILRDAPAGPHRIYLVSDFQESGWNHAAPPLRLAPGIELVPIDVSSPAAANLAVSEVRAEPVVYTQKYTGKVVARLISSSSIPASQQKRVAEGAAEAVVEFKLNDLIVERRQIKLEPQTSQAVEFTGFNVPEGPNRATIEVSGDRFALDNRFHFTIRREDQIKVLSIETASRGRSESFFLQQSLLAGETTPYSLTVKTTGAVEPSELESYSSVILNDIGAVSESFFPALKRFLGRGGGLIIAAGRHTDASDFNRTLGEISPAQIGEVVMNRGGYALMSQIKTDHPIFSPFNRGGRLASTRVYAYHGSTPQERASVISSLDDGSPMIIEGVVGRGKVLLVTTTLDTAWNDLPLSPIFLPLLHQMLDYLVGREIASSYTVGQTFIAGRDRDGSLPSVDSPSGKRIVDLRETKSGDVSIDASEVGIYRLRYHSRTEYVAANLDTRDSDLSKLNMDQFIASVSTDRSDQPQHAAQSGRLTPEEMEARQRVWLPLLALSLVLFVGEAALARGVRLVRLIG